MSGMSAAVRAGEVRWLARDPRAVEAMWAWVEPSVLKLILHSGLRRCPAQHRDAVRDDIQSELFVELHRQDVHNPRGLALTIAAHRIADHIREDARGAGPLRPDAQEPCDAARDAELALALDQAVAALRAADPLAARVVELRLQGATRREIGGALGLSAVRIHRLLKRAWPYVLASLSALVLAAAALAAWPTDDDRQRTQSSGGGPPPTWEQPAAYPGALLPAGPAEPAPFGCAVGVDAMPRQAPHRWDAALRAPAWLEAPTPAVGEPAAMARPASLVAGVYGIGLGRPDRERARPRPTAAAHHDAVPARRS